MGWRIVAAIYYAYPVSLSVALLASNLLLFHYEKGQALVKKNWQRYQLIWYLQALLPLTLLGNILVALLAFRDSLDYGLGSGLLQAQLASYLSVSLYFAAGLLPDPDGPFDPSRSSYHAWLVAIIFELLILVEPKYIDDGQHNLKRLKVNETALGSVRMVILVAMSLVFAMPPKGFFGQPTGSEAEREALLDGLESSAGYTGVGKPKTIAVDAQATGWLDYFVGFSTLFPYIWLVAPQQAIMIFCFGLLICQRIINILVPYQLGILVDALGEDKMPWSTIMLYCLYRGLQGQQGVIGSFRAIIWTPLSQSLYRRLSCAAFEHVLLLSLDFHLSKRIGEVMAALSKGGALNTFLDGFAFQLFPMVFDLGIAAIYLFVNFDAFYSIIVLGVMWSYIFVTIYMAKYRGRARREMATRDRAMDAIKTDAIMAYEMVHYNCAVPSEVSKFGSHVQAFQKAEFAVLFSLNALNAVQNFIFIFGVLLVCMLSAYQISKGLHKVSDFVTLITYFAQLHAPLAFFGSFYNQVQNNLVDAERMLDLFNKKPDVIDDPEAKPLQNCNGQVSFQNVGFAYGPGKAALRNVTFDVEPGTTTAIVGESGSGKSTILKLLFRFYNLNSGRILIDNEDVQNITVQSLRQHIGVVPQDTILFNDSLMYNLLYAKPDASQDEVFDACRAACMHHKILGLNDGYDTVVGERGLKLSGGEKQRIAIARTILKKPQILLLDEATASLDSQTERQIQDALERIARGRTTIAIAHRLSTVTHADRILVLHDGEIVERGRHQELLQMNGRYRAMWNKQTLLEKEEEKSKY